MLKQLSTHYYQFSEDLSLNACQVRIVNSIVTAI